MDNDKQLIDYPKSTRKRIIVPIKTDLYMFDHKTSYEEKFLKHILSKQEFEQIFILATRVMGGSWSKKRNNDIVKIPNFIIGLAVLSVLLTILYMIFIFLSTASDNPALLILSIICVSAASIIAFGLSIYNFTRKLGRFRSLQDIIKEDIERCFTELNKKYEGKLNFVYMVDYAEINIIKPAPVGNDYIKEEEEEEDNQTAKKVNSKKGEKFSTELGNIKED
jgi:hypothetical protein